MSIIHAPKATHECMLVHMCAALLLWYVIKLHTSLTLVPYSEFDRKYFDGWSMFLPNAVLS